jgi:FkbM family methyltransferase
MKSLRTAISSRLNPPPAQGMSTRYGGPTWEDRRQRLFQTLGTDLVLDVGANAGQYGAEIRRNGYAGRIVSFEPASETFARLRQAAGSDSLWTARQLALGSEPGAATLNLAANEGKSSSFLEQRDVSFGTTATMQYVGTETVEVSTLELVGPEVWSARRHDRIALKVDVQGLELQVLDGGGSFLDHVQAIETELSLYPMYEEQPDWRELVDRIEGLGFVLFAVDPGYSDPKSGRLVEMDGLFVRANLAALN